MSDNLIAALRAKAHQSARYNGRHAKPENHVAWKAADEIGRLRAVIRINGLRNGATHAEIDAILSPTPRSPGDVP